tara:strand:+ start:59 stop:262 length:204 start_codon:yes stop_codon:yes gene_type:complete
MAFEKLRGYFYNSDGELLEYYLGYGDLDDMDDLLEFRKSCVGFVSTNQSYDAETFKYNIETQAMVEK